MMHLMNAVPRLELGLCSAWVRDWIRVSLWKEWAPGCVSKALLSASLHDQTITAITADLRLAANDCQPGTAVDNLSYLIEIRH